MGNGLENRYDTVLEERAANLQSDDISIIKDITSESQRRLQGIIRM
jgi:hypothetical protein